MAQRTQLDDSDNPLHEAYACLLANGLDGAGEALRILANPDSCLRLISALLAEQDEEWMTAKIYLTMKP